MTLTVEKQLNWRIARMAFQDPTLKSSGLTTASDRASAAGIFIPHVTNFDLHALREWLHNPDHVAEEFAITGSFEVDRRGRSKFLGINVLFSSIMDAVFFRLAWNGATQAP